jgi:hypothetical protein
MLLSADVIEQLSVGELHALSVDSVKGACHHCGHTWIAVIDVMPDRMSLEHIKSFMSCAACGEAEIELEPIWPTTPPAVQ